MLHRKGGSLVVVSAPSGAGKTTIIRAFLEKYKELSFFSVSLTTRQKREEEQNGIDYFFVSKEEFLRKVKDGELLEWEKVHNNYYGTPKKPIYENMAKGKICILDIDVKGAIKVKREIKEANLVFILPPSIEELINRLKKRGENKEEIDKRMITAREELIFVSNYDYVIINDNLKEAISAFEHIAISTLYKRENYY